MQIHHRNAAQTNYSHCTATHYRFRSNIYTLLYSLSIFQYIRPTILINLYLIHVPINRSLADWCAINVNKDNNKKVIKIGDLLLLES